MFNSENIRKENISAEQTIFNSARRVFKIESQSILDLESRLDLNFVNVVHLIERCVGHLVVTGIGKSGLIGKKIAATLSSLGIPAIFLHAGEGSHGDLGIITRNDIVIAISNSGETEEVLKLLPFFNRFKATLIAMTGNVKSTLAKRSDFILNVGVKEEACSLNLVPTASVAATMAMGDALAVALLDMKGLGEKDFALNHPGGSLGRKLLTTVQDLMRVGESIPIVRENSNIYTVIKEMTHKSLGSTLVMDQHNTLLGIITDGDLRRLIEKQKDISETLASEFMAQNPKTIHKNQMATSAMQIMEEFSITSLVVAEDQKTVVGIIHLHDLLKAGIV
tara:strand:- start:2932 stop:3939 length:1008 start_codon:yes stop_codon:yes gene_type:complete